MNFVKMIPGEWVKPNSNTGEARLDILRKVIKDKTAIPLINGDEVIVNNTPSNLEKVDEIQKLGKPVKLDTNRGEISSSQIGKSPIFGGGSGGSGGGTAQTAYAESLQCLYIHALLDQMTTFEEIQPSDLEKANRQADVGGTRFESMMGLDPSWHYSAYWSAKALIRKGYVNKNHVLHRGSEKMKKIYTMKNQAFKNSGMIKMSDDKWNPGDIWAIDKRVNLDRELDTSSIDALNASLVKLFDSKKVVGISLKKILKEGQMKLSVLNRESGEVDVHSYTGSSLMATNIRTATFFRGKQGKVTFDRTGSMDVRTSAAYASPNMEIQLKTARGGRASWAQVIQAAKRRCNFNMPSNLELKAMARNIESGNKRLAEEFYKMAKAVHVNLDKKQFMEELATQDGIRIHSKLAATYVTSMLEKNKRSGKSDEFVSDLVNYAGSKTAESSIYVKVYQ